MCVCACVFLCVCVFSFLVLVVSCRVVSCCVVYSRLVSARALPFYPCPVRRCVRAAGESGAGGACCAGRFGERREARVHLNYFLFFTLSLFLSFVRSAGLRC